MTTSCHHHCDVIIAPFQRPGAEGLKKLSRPTDASGNTPAIPSLSGIINRSTLQRPQPSPGKTVRLSPPFAVASRSAGATCAFPSHLRGFPAQERGPGESRDTLERQAAVEGWAFGPEFVASLSSSLFLCWQSRHDLGMHLHRKHGIRQNMQRYLHPAYMHQIERYGGHHSWNFDIIMSWSSWSSSSPSPRFRHWHRG